MGFLGCMHHIACTAAHEICDLRPDPSVSDFIHLWSETETDETSRQQRLRPEAHARGVALGGREGCGTHHSRMSSLKTGVNLMPCAV